MENVAGTVYRVTLADTPWGLFKEFVTVALAVEFAVKKADSKGYSLDIWRVPPDDGRPLRIASVWAGMPDHTVWLLPRGHLPD